MADITNVCWQWLSWFNRYYADYLDNGITLSKRYAGEKILFVRRFSQFSLTNGEVFDKTFDKIHGETTKQKLAGVKTEILCKISDTENVFNRSHSSFENAREGS